MLGKWLEVCPWHLGNMSRINGKDLCAGGILDETGNMKGSVLIIDFDSRDQLDAYLEAEPHIIGNVWEKVAVEPMNVVLLNGEKDGKQQGSPPFGGKDERHG